MDEFSGKVIYNPSGKAGEYSYWAANIFVGCSNGCIYCYLKKGRGAKVLGGNVPTLKKTLHNPHLALFIFEKEVKSNVSELQKHGLFFSFTTDPLLDETAGLTIGAVRICQYYHVPVKILTKCCGDGLTRLINTAEAERWDKSKIQIGFTLTGFDDREPNASPNKVRIETIYKLRSSGFPTFASIEPVIDFNRSFQMIVDSIQHCQLFKIGLESGGKYSKTDIREFIDRVNELVKNDMIYYKLSPKIYWKDGILKAAGIDRAELPEFCIERDYNVFQNE